MKKISLTIFILFLITRLIAQPNIQWQKCLGGSSYETANCIIQTFDKGYIVAGSSHSNDSDVTGNHGGSDYWIVKLDSSGIIEWQKSYGGTGTETAYYIQQTNDSGFVIAGTSDSHDGDVTINHGSLDCWIVKLNSTGTIQWQKSFGGTNEDGAKSIQQTNDTGYIIAGYSWSNNGDVTGNHGVGDYWIVKLNSTGTIQWQKCLGGTDIDESSFVVQTFDGGYIVTGYALSIDDDVIGNHGVSDYWIVKLNSSGILQWQKALGGSGTEYEYSILQTTDSGYVVSGWSESNDGDVTGNHGGDYDCWIVKLNSIGTIQWQKCLGGSGDDRAYGIYETPDEGYIFTGITNSNDGDVSGNHGIYDYWIVKINSAGTMQWQKCLGGTDWEMSSSIFNTNDGSFIIAGWSQSNNGDVTGNLGSQDYWVVKMDSSFFTNEKDIYKSVTELKTSPNPISQSTLISFSLFQKEKVIVNIYDITGRVVKTLIHSQLEMGFHSLTWDLTDNTRSRIENGIYLLSILTDNGTITKRIEVIK